MREEKMLLYHYTSIGTLDKILSNKTFRLTNMDNLNDKSEYRYGVNLLKNKITDFEQKNHITDSFDLTLLDRFMFSGKLYSVSFTENVDDLYFWNSYYIDKDAPIALGIDKDILFDDNLILNKCIYGDPYPNMEFDRYVWFKNILTLALSKDRELIHITFQTAHIKQNCFAIENEWRAISFPLSPIQEFYRGEDKCFCFDYPINIKAIKAIIIGPCKNQKMNYNIVCSMINKLELKVDIKCSQIPIVL